MTGRHGASAVAAVGSTPGRKALRGWRVAGAAGA